MGLIKSYNHIDKQRYIKNINITQTLSSANIDVLLNLANQTHNIKLSETFCQLEIGDFIWKYIFPEKIDVLKSSYHFDNSLSGYFIKLIKLLEHVWDLPKEILGYQQFEPQQPNEINNINHPMVIDHQFNTCIKLPKLKIQWFERDICLGLTLFIKNCTSADWELWPISTSNDPISSPVGILCDSQKPDPVCLLKVWIEKFNRPLDLNNFIKTYVAENRDPRLDSSEKSNSPKNNLPVPNTKYEFTLPIYGNIDPETVKLSFYRENIKLSINKLSPHNKTWNLHTTPHMANNYDLDILKSSPSQETTSPPTPTNSNNCSIKPLFSIRDQTMALSHEINANTNFIGSSKRKEFGCAGGEAQPSNNAFNYSGNNGNNGMANNANNILKLQQSTHPNTNSTPIEENEELSSDVTEIPFYSKGYCGLHNLGNTCFMNCVIQILSNTKPLRNYFLSNRYGGELNVDNPLGLNGELAEAFAELLRDMWSGKHTSISPFKLKSLISVKANQFIGYAQHDAQEFLAFLLDGLHEDLNRVKIKPYTAQIEAIGKSDAQIADDTWAYYKSRNDSFIHELFLGQYKSLLTCPECKTKSTTFDPLLYMTLPLPEKCVPLIIYYFPNPSDPNHEIRPIKFIFRVTRGSLVSSIAQRISAHTRKDSSKITFMEVDKSRFVRYLGPDEDITINNYNHYNNNNNTNNNYSNYNNPSPCCFIGMNGPSNNSNTNQFYAFQALPDSNQSILVNQTLIEYELVPQQLIKDEKVEQIEREQAQQTSNDEDIHMTSLPQMDKLHSIEPRLLHPRSNDTTKEKGGDEEMEVVSTNPNPPSNKELLSFEQIGIDTKSTCQTENMDTDQTDVYESRDVDENGHGDDVNEICAFNPLSSTAAAAAAATRNQMGDGLVVQRDVIQNTTSDHDLSSSNKTSSFTTAAAVSSHVGKPFLYFPPPQSRFVGSCDLFKTIRLLAGLSVEYEIASPTSSQSHKSLDEDVTENLREPPRGIVDVEVASINNLPILVKQPSAVVVTATEPQSSTVRPGLMGGVTPLTLRNNHHTHTHLHSHNDSTSHQEQQIITAIKNRSDTMSPHKPNIKLAINSLPQDQTLMPPTSPKCHNVLPTRYLQGLSVENIEKDLGKPCKSNISLVENKPFYDPISSTNHAKYPEAFLRSPPTAKSSMSSLLSSPPSSPMETNLFEQADITRTDAKGIKTVIAKTNNKKSCYHSAIDCISNADDDFNRHQNRTTNHTFEPIKSGCDENSENMPFQIRINRSFDDSQNLAVEEIYHHTTDAVIDFTNVTSITVEWFKHTISQSLHQGQIQQSFKICDKDIVHSTHKCEDSVNNCNQIRARNISECSNPDNMMSRLEEQENTLQNCLKLFSKKEILTPDDAWYCPKCQKHTQAEKTMSLWRFPEILVIIFKRFAYGSLFWREKLDKLITYPLDSLDLSEIYEGTSTIKPIYDLYGVINHQGTLHGGHYTSFACLLPSTSNSPENIELEDIVDDSKLIKTWRFFDDNSVTDVYNICQIVSPASYVLFYKLRR